MSTPSSSHTLTHKSLTTHCHNSDDAESWTRWLSGYRGRFCTNRLVMHHRRQIAAERGSSGILPQKNCQKCYHPRHEQILQ